MIYVLVAIKDRAIEAFQQVFTVRAEGEAIRGFMDAINNANSGNMAKHPEDFDLFVVGNFDDDTGTITPEGPRKIGDGKQLAIQNAE